MKYIRHNNDNSNNNNNNDNNNNNNNNNNDNNNNKNRLFKNNQRQFYRELDKKEGRCDDQPVAKESKQFWGNIWSQPADHKKDANWLQDLRSEDSAK